MLITPALLQQFNGIYQEEADLPLVNIYIGSAQQIVSDYVGFDCETVIPATAEDEEDIATTEDAEVYPEPVQELFKLTILRIATLLQSEGGANIGFNNSSAEGVSRTFLNVVDYTPYLKQLSSFRKNTDI